MGIVGMEISEIVDLGTQVASTGAIRAMEIVGDDVFQYVIAIAIIVYEMDPG